MFKKKESTNQHPTALPSLFEKQGKMPSRASAKQKISSPKKTQDTGSTSAERTNLVLISPGATISPAKSFSPFSQAKSFSPFSQAKSFSPSSQAKVSKLSRGGNKKLGKSMIRNFLSGAKSSDDDEKGSNGKAAQRRAQSALPAAKKASTVMSPGGALLPFKEKAVPTTKVKGEAMKSPKRATEEALGEPKSPDPSSEGSTFDISSPLCVPNLDTEIDLIIAASQQASENKPITGGASLESVNTLVETHEGSGTSKPSAATQPARSKTTATTKYPSRRGMGDAQHDDERHTEAFLRGYKQVFETSSKDTDGDETDLKVSSLQMQIKREQERAARQKEKAEKRIDSLEQKNKDNKRTIADLRHQVEDLKFSKKRSSDPAIEKLKQQHMLEMRKKDAEMANLRQELEDIKFQNLIEDKDKQLHDIQFEIECIEHKKVSVLKEQVETLTKKLEGSQSQVTSLEEKLAAARIEALEREALVTKTKEREALINSMEKLISNMDKEREERDTLLDERDALIDELEKERDELVKQGEEREAVIDDMDKEREEREILIEDLENEREERDALIDERDALIDERDTLLKERDAFIDDMEKEHEADLECMQNKAEDYMDTISHLRLELDEATLGNRMVEMEHEIVQQLQHITKKHDKQRILMNELKTEADEAKEKVTALEAELELTQQLVKAMQEESDENDKCLEKHKQVVQNLMEQLEKCHNEKKIQHQELSEQLEQARQENATCCLFLNKKVEEAEELVAKLQQELAEQTQRQRDAPEDVALNLAVPDLDADTALFRVDYGVAMEHLDAPEDISLAKQQQGEASSCESKSTQNAATQDPDNTTPLEADGPLLLSASLTRENSTEEASVEEPGNATSRISPEVEGALLPTEENMPTEKIITVEPVTVQRVTDDATMPSDEASKPGNTQLVASLSSEYFQSFYIKAFLVGVTLIILLNPTFNKKPSVDDK